MLGRRANTASMPTAPENKKVRDFGKGILNGNIDINPYEMDQRSSCKYCAYRSICGFDEKIPGFSMRNLELQDKDAKALIVDMYKNK